MQAIKIIAARLAVLGAVAQNAKSDDEQAVSQSDDGFAHAAFGCLAIEERSQIAVLLPTCGPGGLTQSAPQSAVPFARAITEPFAAALMIAGAKPGPAGRVFRAGEDPHVGAEFGQQGPGGDDIDAGNGAQARNLLRIHLWRDGLLQTRDPALR